ncbi:MAG: ornithine carbamoyltransferase [Bacteriovoracaceae bacterium]|nr:ornithine carbamoyltransferase [Bacteriovoracaceae bacterium]
MQYNNSKHFLTGSELGDLGLQSLINKASDLKAERDQGKIRNDLQGKTLVMLFEKPSLRTRLSFSVAMQELGGSVLEAPSSLRKHEEPEDLAGVLSGYAHGVMIRTHGHDIVERMAKVSRVPIINGLTDDHHPCQALADLLTLQQRFGSLPGLTLTYIGDGNNILHALLLTATAVGVNIRYACPEGYLPKEEIVALAKSQAKFGATVTGFTDPVEASKGADALYTDVWTSMGFEEENEKRLQAFKGFQLNKNLQSVANQKAAIMHCMPMVRDQEISGETADCENSVIYQQAENRLHVQKALLLGLMGG